MKIRKAIVQGDLVIGFVGGDVEGVEVPPHLFHLGTDELRCVRGRIIAASEIKTWHIDGEGLKHAVPGRGWHTVTCDHDAYMEQDAKGHWQPEPRDNALLAYLANRRWQAEGSGVVFKGKPVHTDRDSQAMIAALTLAYGGSAKKTIVVKAADGTALELSGKELVALQAAMAEHMQQCFELEINAAERIASGEIKFKAQIDKLKWPTREAKPKVQWMRYHEDAKP